MNPHLVAATTSGEQRAAIKVKEENTQIGGKSSKRIEDDDDEEEGGDEGPDGLQWHDPRWRSTKAGKASYAKFQRDKQKTAPTEVHDNFDRKQQGELFKLWIKNAGDWMEVCYETGIKTRDTQSSNSVYKLVSKAEIVAKFGDPGLGSTVAKQSLHHARHDLCKLESHVDTMRS